MYTKELRSLDMIYQHLRTEMNYMDFGFQEMPIKKYHVGVPYYQEKKLMRFRVKKLLKNNIALIKTFLFYLYFFNQCILNYDS